MITSDIERFDCWSQVLSQRTGLGSDLLADKIEALFVLTHQGRRGRTVWVCGTQPKLIAQSADRYQNTERVELFHVNVGEPQRQEKPNPIKTSSSILLNPLSQNR